MKKIKWTCFFVLLLLLISISLPVEAAELVKKYKTIQVKQYQAKTKETIWSIAQSYQVPMEKIVDFNQLKSKKIKQGQEIKVPYFKTVNLVQVKKDETLWSISQQFDTTVEKLKLYNDLTTNSIYQDQYLIVVKDNSDAFYTEEEIGATTPLYLKGKRDYWVLPALAKLSSLDKSKQKIVKNIPQSDTLTQLRLTLMLDEILGQLKEINNKNLEERIEKLAVKNKELAKIAKANKKQTQLNKKELASLKNTVNLFEDELSELGIKTNELEEKIKFLIKEHKEEKQYTDIKLSGAHKVEWMEVEGENHLYQNLFLNWQNRITSGKEVDVFLQGRRDYHHDQQEAITFGSQGDVQLNDATSLGFRYAYRHPFNQKELIPLTYFDLAWRIDTSYFESEVFSAQANSPTYGDPKLVNSATTVFKTDIFDIKLNYKDQDQGFQPVFVQGDTILDPDYLIEEKENYSGSFIFPVHKIVDLEVSGQGLEYFSGENYMGGSVGINLHDQQNNWWKLNYIKWEAGSREDYRVTTGFNLDTNYLIVKSDLNYIAPADKDLESTLQVKSELIAKLTDALEINLAYNEEVDNPAFRDYKAGIKIKF